MVPAFGARRYPLRILDHQLFLCRRLGGIRKPGNYCGHIEAYDKVGPLTRLLLRTAVALAVFLTTGLLLYIENYFLK